MQEAASLRLDAWAARFCPPAGKGTITGVTLKTTTRTVGAGNTRGGRGAVSSGGDSKRGKSRSPPSTKKEKKSVLGVRKTARSAKLARQSTGADRGKANT